VRLSCLAGVGLVYVNIIIKLFCPCVLALLHECATAFAQIVCYGAVWSAILATAGLLVICCYCYYYYYYCHCYYYATTTLIF